MSAYIVSDLHINTIVTWAITRHGSNAVRYYWRGVSRDVRHKGAQRIASVLYSENVRSVNTRYNDCESPVGFVFRNVPYACNKTPVEIIKACHCLAYQSCETSDWEETEAFAVLQAIESTAVRMLPGYDEADWSIHEPAKEAS